MKRNFVLERYFDNDLYLVRFSTIQDLEKRLKDDKDLKIINFDFQSNYDYDWQDYRLMLEIEDTNGDKYDLDLWYALTRIGEKIIIETSYEKIGD